MSEPTESNHVPIQQITGVVLAGGRGTRMGGVDKGLETLAGKPLVQHVLTCLAPQVGSLMISANRSLDQYQSFGHPVFSDAVGGFAGPLAGLHAALLACKTEWLACVPCDAPYVAGDLVTRLCAGRNGGLAATACVNGKLQPVFSLIHCSLSNNLHTYLQSGGRKTGEWLQLAGSVRVEFLHPNNFTNLNTNAELCAAEPRTPG